MKAMNHAGQYSFPRLESPRPGRSGRLGLAAALALWAVAASVRGDGTVVTLGGGPTSANPNFFGFADGLTLQDSQFHSPYGCAVDNAGNLFVADRDNGAIRRIQVNVAVNTSQTITLLSNLPSPVAIAFDRATNFYVVTTGNDNRVRKYTSFGNFVTNWPALNSPTALAVDANTNIYVTELGGAVKWLNPTNAGPSGVVVIEPTGTFHQPQGIAALSSGLIAVSDTGSNAVYLVNPATKTFKLLAGNNGPGFTNGPPPYAAFNQPWNLFQAPSGNLIVADRGNHRVRVITITGLVTTLYGVDPTLWDPSPALSGWADGPGGDQLGDAEARDPVGVTVDSAGVVYTTEDFYHLIREVTASGFTGAGGTGAGGSNAVVVIPPIISPNSGYYPMGQTITVSNLNSSDFFAPAVYYTTDGTDPTTNSLPVALTNNLGTILWRNTTNDLTSLKLKAFLGSFASVTVSGQPAATNTVGIPTGLNTNVLAGIGSTIVLPVVVNLGTNQELRSIEYRVDLTPEGSPSECFAPNILPDGFHPLPVSTNDAILLAGASSTPGALVTNLFLQLTNLALHFTNSACVNTNVVTDELGIVTSPNANFLAKNFAVVGLLGIRIPPTAVNGDRYTIQVKYPEGTSDGLQTSVPLTSMPALEIVVSTNVGYLVSDTGPANWYNAEAGTGFGEGNISNDDVNNVLSASIGLRVPFPFTDLFDAMDVFPEDTATAAGGDGQIRYLDWQLTLMRALRFDTNNWKRFWAPGGIRIPVHAGLSGSLNSPAQLVSDPPPGAVWVRQASLHAGSVPNAVPNTTVTVPIYLSVVPGASVSGMDFRAVITNSTPNATQLQSAVAFSPAPGIPTPPIFQGNLPPNQIVCAWGLGAFSPSLQGSNLLGYLQFLLPSDAPATTRYDVQFAVADGSPDITTQYDFETFPGTALVLSTNLPPPQITSVEWKTNFFGSADNPLAADNADPDGDGVPNWAEYLAGTNPTNALSRLQLLTPTAQTNGGVVLSWLSAPFKAYAVESAPGPGSTNWTPVGIDLVGDGNLVQVACTNSSSITRFYRIRLQP